MALGFAKIGTRAKKGGEPSKMSLAVFTALCSRSIAGLRRATKIRPKPVAGGIFVLFSNFEKCRSEVADDVVSDVAVD